MTTYRAGELADARWITSSYSGSGGGNCVQVAGGQAVRDSKLGDDSPVLLFPPTQLAAFVTGVRAGQFD